MCSSALFETSFSYDKEIWIAATDYYMHFYIIMLIPLTTILQLINFTASYFCVTSIYAVWHIGIASLSNFVASASSVGGVVCRRHTFYSGQYLKNGLSVLIQIWHVDVTGPESVLYSFVTLNSH